MKFHTDIKGKYSIVSDAGKLAGSIDGVPLRDSQQILPGDHQLDLAAGKGNVAMVWTQALDRGLQPIHQKKQNHRSPGIGPKSPIRP